jgi:hypothetical protein
MLFSFQEKKSMTRNWVHAPKRDFLDSMETANNFLSYKTNNHFRGQQTNKDQSKYQHGKKETGLQTLITKDSDFHDVLLFIK